MRKLERLEKKRGFLKQYAVRMMKGAIPFSAGFACFESIRAVVVLETDRKRMMSLNVGVLLSGVLLSW